MDDLTQIRDFFNQITELDPYGDYQLIPSTVIADGHSVVLRMPTGSGKSESLLCAYLWALKQNLDFPQQMIYGLPMRNLVDMLGKRFAKYQKNFSGLSVATQHGAAAGTPKLFSDIAIATIDQIISAYACVPLGYPVRMGNIPAGAVASAFLAFDEVHTFDPERALQSTLFILEHSRKLGIPFALLSATIPDSFAEILENDFDAKVIDVDEKDIPVRMARRVKLTNRLFKYLELENVIDAWNETDKSILVVCNTVERAKMLWKQVREQLQLPGTLLLHSQFTRADRKANEGKLDDLVGKNPTRKGIVITTQVVEVGLDVSTLLMLTELSPIDSLIQRAGRVARWGGQGEVRVFGVENSLPYSKQLVEFTRSAIKAEEILLDWKCEKSLVNQVLNDSFREYLSSEARGQARYWLGEGSFSGKRADVAKAIRGQTSCTVAIHSNPDSLGRQVWRLPQIPLFAWTLKKFADKQGTRGIWRVEVDKDSDLDSEQKWSVNCVPLRIPEEVRPNSYYVLAPNVARYEPRERGLVLGESNEMDFQPESKLAKRELAYGRRRRESWVKHSRDVLDVFYNTFLPRYEGVLARLGKRWQVSQDEFIARTALAIGLHDLGKLNQEWQVKIGRRKGEPPIAHSGDEKATGKLPPHATISAYNVTNLFHAHWGRKASEPLLCTIAHHHSVGATNLPSFQLIDEWGEQVAELLASYPMLLPLWDKNQVVPLTLLKSPAELEPKMIAIESERSWRTYTILSRILRLCDQMATGGSEYVLLCDEDWLTDV